MLVITHYQRLLNHIVPDYVHILADGKILGRVEKSLLLRWRSQVMPASTMQPNLEAVTGLTGVRAGAMQRWLKKAGPIIALNNGVLHGFRVLKKWICVQQRMPPQQSVQKPFRLCCPIRLSSSPSAMVFWISRPI